MNEQITTALAEQGVALNTHANSLVTLRDDINNEMAQVNQRLEELEGGSDPAAVVAAIRESTARIATATQALDDAANAVRAIIPDAEETPTTGATAAASESA